MQHKRIFLVGPMGAGKTTVGRRLALLTGLPFYDSDHDIEDHTGVDIPYIFDREGENGFRKRETETIDRLTQIPELVLSTGGGVVTQAENRRLLAERGLVIYLHTSVEQQLARTKRDTKRPLLRTADPGAKLRELMTIREPLYRQLADIIIDTNGRHTRGVAASLHKQLLAPSI